MEEKATLGKVLLADDNELVRRACTRVLSAAGYVVEAAADGTTALRLLSEQSFDAVVSDLSMPGLDGMELLRFVRRTDLDLPVVLMTGAPSIATAAEAVEQGALRYLVKPFDVQNLASVVTTATRLYRLAKAKREVLGYMDAENLTATRVGLGTKLDGALGQLWIAYQPIVSWSGKKLFAYEALMRSDEASLAHPEAILHAAEQLGRLGDVGRRVRGQVADLLDRQREISVFVNLHPYDLLDEELYAASAPLTSHSSRVVLEITERASLDSIADVATKTSRLRELGYRIAVDDLGAGYSGLTSFAQLGPDFAKLDMSLIRNIDREPTRRVLVEALFDACGALNIPVVAEGVETSAERDTLLSGGAELFQGYLFGRPRRDLEAPNFI